jgi:hypothetical protein
LQGFVIVRRSGEMKNNNDTSRKEERRARQGFDIVKFLTNSGRKPTHSKANADLESEDDVVTKSV